MPLMVSLLEGKGVSLRLSKEMTDCPLLRYNAPHPSELAVGPSLKSALRSNLGA